MTDERGGPKACSAQMHCCVADNPGIQPLQPANCLPHRVPVLIVGGALQDGGPKQQGWATAALCMLTAHPPPMQGCSRRRRTLTISSPQSASAHTPSRPLTPNSPLPGPAPLPAPPFRLHHPPQLLPPPPLEWGRGRPLAPSASYRLVHCTQLALLALAEPWALAVAVAAAARLLGAAALAGLAGRQPCGVPAPALAPGPSWRPVHEQAACRRVLPPVRAPPQALVLHMLLLVPLHAAQGPPLRRQAVWQK